MIATTFQPLHTDNFLSVSLDLSLIQENFKSIDEFMRNFIVFQKKFTEIERIQKSTKQDISSFKLQTQSHFETVDQMLESRNQIGQGKSAQATQELNEIKKSIKDLKSFMTESTRQQHQAQQIKQEEQSQYNIQTTELVKKLSEEKSNLEKEIIQIQSQFKQFILKSATKIQITDLSFTLESQMEQCAALKEGFNSIQKILLNSKVEEFKILIDELSLETRQTLEQMKVKLRLKADASDMMKLQEMILNTVEFMQGKNLKRFAHSSETKKALIFLEKRMNSMLITLLGDDEKDRQALLTSKSIKCISCSKDLGDMEGKLDKYKPWAVFPVKQPHTKDKYSGFGSGFQSVVETSISKKGGQITVDEKGRMTKPFNLTSAVKGSSHTKDSKNQHKLQQIGQTERFSSTKLGFSPSPSKNSLKYETNFMMQFGANKQHEKVQVRQYYIHEEGGLQNFARRQSKN